MFLKFITGAIAPVGRSPEAETAITIFERWQNELVAPLKKSISGQELINQGFVSDVELAAVLNNSNCVPLLTRNSFYLKQ